MTHDATLIERVLDGIIDEAKRRERFVTIQRWELEAALDASGIAQLREENERLKARIAEVEGELIAQRVKYEGVFSAREQLARLKERVAELDGREISEEEAVEIMVVGGFRGNTDWFDIMTGALRALKQHATIRKKGSGDA